MEILEIQGVRFNLEGMKGITKSKFVAQNKNRFKNPEIIWDMIADKVEVKKKAKKKTEKKEEKIEAKVSFEKVTKESKDSEE